MKPLSLSVSLSLSLAWLQPPPLNIWRSLNWKINHLCIEWNNTNSQCIAKIDAMVFSLTFLPFTFKTIQWSNLLSLYLMLCLFFQLMSATTTSVHPDPGGQTGLQVDQLGFTSSMIPGGFIRSGRERHITSVVVVVVIVIPWFYTGLFYQSRLPCASPAYTMMESITVTATTSCRGRPRSKKPFISTIGPVNSGVPCEWKIWY